MKLFRYTLRTYWNSMHSVRFAYFVIVMLVTLLQFQQPLLDYSRQMQYPVSIWVLPFLMTSFPFLAMFYFCVLYVNGDIPLMQYTQMYPLLRLGRKNWIIAQLGSLLLRSFTLVMMTFVLSILTLLPRLEIGNDWGKLIRTAQLTNAQSELHFTYRFSAETFVSFTPAGLTALVIFLCTLVCMLLAVSMLAVCLYTNRAIAVAVGMVQVLLFIVIANIHPRARLPFARLVPTCWVEVAKLYTPDHGFLWLPSIPYMVAVLLCVIAALCLLAVHRIKTIEFQWEDDL